MEFSWESMVLGMIFGLVLKMALDYLKKQKKPQNLSKETKITSELNPRAQSKVIETKAKTVEPPLKTVSSSAPKMSNLEYLQKFILLGDIAQKCEEYVEIEEDLIQKERDRLYLERLDFKKEYRQVLTQNRESF